MKPQNINFTNGSIYSISNLQRSFLGKYKKSKLALICLHGGPGYPHNYLLNLFSLRPELPIIMYDQIGCGKSSFKSDYSKININSFVEELEIVRSYYNVDDIILYGHSWGSILALEYYLSFPKSVCGIVFASPCISIPWWIEDSKHYLKQLPISDQTVIESCNNKYSFFDPEYIKATKNYYALCVGDDSNGNPALVECDQSANSEIYTRFWGPNEFTITGSLSRYNGNSNLKQVTIPKLFLTGEFDECLPATCKRYSEICPNSTYSVIPNAKHFINLDNPKFLANEISLFFNSLV